MIIMNKKLFKYLMSAASAAAFASYGALAFAHTQTGSLGDDAGAADIYQVTCATGDTTTGRLEVSIINVTPSSPLLSVVVERNGLSASVTDTVSGDSNYSDVASVTAGDGPYTVTLTKDGAGSLNYSMEFHCKTGAGLHTGDDTSIAVLEDDATTAPSPTDGVTGAVFQLNTSGTQYCPGAKPVKFSPSSDVDLWFHVDSDTQITAYRDAELTVPVATLDVAIDSYAANAASFVTSYYADADNHFEAVGVIKFKKDGSAKSLKASFLRKGILDSCYSKGTLTGKRVN